jgi:tripeptide aminopeptidase
MAGRLGWAAVSEVIDLFLELAAIASPSGEERPVADRVLAYLRDLGLSPDEDASGPEVGSNMGNIYLRLEPTVEGEPIFLCAHLDTVPPVDAIEPVVEDGIVRNKNQAILGGDNKAAVAAMLEATRRVVAENRPHAGIELVFTSKEEVGLLGAYAFDHTRLHAKVGYVYDDVGPIGGIVLGAPSAFVMEVEFHGRAAHAGMHPEEGRSAIAAAARAISEMKLGRIDDETTANIGTIHGGTAGNVVPDHCVLVGEARSHSDEKLSAQIQAMQDALTFAAGVADCDVETKLKKHYTAYRFSRDDLAVKLAAEALARCGHEPRYTLCGGAADSNVFNERGLQCVNLANAMTEIHTPDEYIAVADVEAMVDVTLALFDAAQA